ncbi:MAG: hypothetical protein MMC33_001649 [Icmadophila ericetorum]|nr:hypothetical protein [Icmadophila ericetorum]
MADGLNEARALRVMEVVNDFRALQHHISNAQPQPRPEEYYELGYDTLRRCRTEAQQILASPFDTSALQASGSSGENEKRQLQRVLLDATARRFRAQKIYLQTNAAIRWVNSRNAILQGQKPHAGHMLALQQVDAALRTELAGITNERIVNDLMMKDWQKGHWLDEDPSLQTLLNWIQLHR